MKRLRSVPSRDCAASPELRLAATPIVRAALLEDVGRGGDLTTEAIVEPESPSDARESSRVSGGIVAGLDVAMLAFRLLDETRRVVEAASATASASSRRPSWRRSTERARAILTGERTALNCSRDSRGIATATRALVDLVAGTRAKIADTRKTTPGLRALERYAVACGGGANHRFGLDDGVLIKDNHLALAGSIHAAVAAARAASRPHGEDRGRSRNARAAARSARRTDRRRAARQHDAGAAARKRLRSSTGASITEASGGVTNANVAEIARTGVDVISVGRLTHSAPALDLSLRNRSALELSSAKATIAPTADDEERDHVARDARQRDDAIFSRRPRSVTA